MTTVYIRGASDDLIEIEGDVEEEFYAAKEGNYLAFDDGTILFIKYGVGGGFWRINTIKCGSATMMKVDGTDEEHDYSDHVTLVGDLKSVVIGSDYAIGRVDGGDRRTP